METATPRTGLGETREVIETAWAAAMELVIAMALAIGMASAAAMESVTGMVWAIVTGSETAMEWVTVTVSVTVMERGIVAAHRPGPWIERPRTAVAERVAAAAIG